jgi:ribosomal protein L37AE/L43A
MCDLVDYRCPSCNSVDVARIQTEAIYDELIQCRSCEGIYPMEYVGGAAEPSAGLVEGSRHPKHSRRGGL